MTSAIQNPRHLLRLILDDDFCEDFQSLQVDMSTQKTHLSLTLKTYSFYDVIMSKVHFNSIHANSLNTFFPNQINVSLDFGDTSIINGKIFQLN